MNKYTWIFAIFFILIFATYLADLTTVVANAETGTDIIVPTGADSVTIWSMIGTYTRIMGFRLEGFPAILNLLIFYPLTAVLVYLVAEVVKDIIPFT